jgi:hypothetical protein
MNNIYELLPFKGLSDLLFGTSRSEIRQKIDAEFSENGEIDFYVKLGVFFEFENDKCCFIEILSSNSVIYQSHNLTSMFYSDLRKIFDMKSNNIDDEKGFGVNYIDLGFGVSVDDSDNFVKTVSLFKKGYWED